jgi:hypothetical protein
VGLIGEAQLGGEPGQIKVACGQPGLDDSTTRQGCRLLLT